MSILRIAMAQIDPLVGDIAGNTQRMLSIIRDARSSGVDVVTFPELAVTGYPPEDLLLKPRFVTDNEHALAELAHECVGIVVVVGYVGQGEVGKQESPRYAVVTADQRRLYNAAAILGDGRCIASYGKRLLPNYGVFDEARYFWPGQRIPPVNICGSKLAVSLGEDMWRSEGSSRDVMPAGAEVIVNIHASPFHVGKSRIREQILSAYARETAALVVSTNMVGGQDELIFDGNSTIVDQHGEVIARAKAFEEDLVIADLDVERVRRSRVPPGRKTPHARSVTGKIERSTGESLISTGARAQVVSHLEPALGELEEVYKGLVLGVKDYVRKNGFQRAVIGLSGGVDSALTAVIAVDALGAGNVSGIFMPSPYTSVESAEDTTELCSRLAIECRTISITGLFEAYLHSLAPVFQGQPVDITEENIQARIRGNILMAVSNKFGHVVLTTGNKSEMSVGYATLYGDMAGGFAVIKDVPKTMVYELARLRNRAGATAVIPSRILERPPTAELKPNQKDEDSLPPYSILDPILKAYVEENRSVEEIVALGFDCATIMRVVNMVDRSEYKRKQAPIGIKITRRGLGKDRRMPITNGYGHSLRVL